MRKLGQTGYRFAQDRGSVLTPHPRCACSPVACHRPPGVLSRWSSPMHYLKLEGLAVGAPPLGSELQCLLACSLRRALIPEGGAVEGGRCSSSSAHQQAGELGLDAVWGSLPAARPAWAPPPCRAAAQESVAEERSQAGADGFVFTFCWRRTLYRHQWHFTSRTHVPSRPRLLSGSLLATAPSPPWWPLSNCKSIDWFCLVWEVMCMGLNIMRSLCLASFTQQYVSFLLCVFAHGSFSWLYSIPIVWINHI